MHTFVCKHYRKLSVFNEHVNFCFQFTRCALSLHHVIDYTDKSVVWLQQMKIIAFIL